MLWFSYLRFSKHRLGVWKQGLTLIRLRVFKFSGNNRDIYERASEVSEGQAAP
jgi:hypothetical protein